MNAGYEPSSLPLAGAVLCCTSISPEQRHELSHIGVELGATVKLDLTSDVTHLIVGNINSAKYRYVAKSREDVKVVTPEWIEGMRQEWIKGGEVDVAAVEKEYRLPTFYGLKICLTGFDDADQRRYIQETAASNGAEYHGDLTKSVTHLIAATPTGKKYEYAINWKMKVVSWEWFEQSLLRGMALEEAYFDPKLSVEERGKGAWERRAAPSPTFGKRLRGLDDGPPPNPLKRKLRRSASSRLGSQSQALWAGITAASVNRNVANNDDWNEEDSTNAQPLEAEAPQRDESIAQDNTHPSGEPPQPEAVARQDSWDDGIFQGRIVFTHKFDALKTKILRDHLASNGALVIHKPTELLGFSEDDLKRGFMVIPHDDRADLTSLPKTAETLTLATNWWVERCLYAKKLVDPAEHVLCRPISNIAIAGFDNLTINCTAFTGMELLHVTKAVAMMGAKYDEFLTKNTSVLVCNTKKPSAEKFKFASENGIPIVHAGWLWECLEARVLKPFGVHVLKAAHPQPQKPIRQPQQPYTDVPTAPISEEDSANLRRRKAQAAKPASKPQPRKIKQRPGELALSLATNPTLASTTSPRNPFSTDDGPSEDEEGIPANDGPASPQPLQDINPSVNSSRRPSNSSTSTNAKSKAACTSTSESNATNPPPKPAPVPRKTEPTEENQAGPAAIDPPVEKKEDPAIIMSRILAQRKTAAEYQNLEKEETRKKKRQLGRATSNPSTASGTELDSRAGSAVPAEPSPDDLSLSERERERDDDPKNVNVAEVYKPSQELGWDDPGAQAARERMIRAMGGRVEETGVVVVEPTGVMKDIVSEGGRGRRRRL